MFNPDIFNAGVPGFEPGSGGSKGRCLTAWLHPNSVGITTQKNQLHKELVYKCIEKTPLSQTRKEYY